MQYTAHDLKEKLLKALDKDNNVVDMAGVLEVISTLETFPITRECLEQTRIGRFINELRKKTTDEQLAKRAKKLVRSWQKLINPQAESVTVNGDKDNGEKIAPRNSGFSSVQGSRSGTPVVSPALSQNSLSPALRKISPQSSVRSSLSKQGLVGNVQSTPSLQGGRPTTPKLQYNRVQNKPGTPSLPQIQPGKSKPSTPTLPPHVLPRSKPSTPNLQQYSDKGLSPQLRTESPKYHSTPKTVNSPSKYVPTIPACRASPVASPVASDRSKTPSDTLSDSRPQTPVAGCQVDDLTNRLSSSQDNCSNQSVSASSDSKFKLKTNHSKESRISPPCKTPKTDQSLNAKTNVANKKRTRDDVNNSAIPNKRSHVANDKASHKNVLNGAVSTSNEQSEKSSQDPLWLIEARAASNSNNSDSRLSFSDSRQSFSSKRSVSLAVKTETPKSSDKMGKTPKVKTTAQLIAELQAKSGSVNVGSTVIKQIETNQIQKESDVPESVLPPGARPKRRKKAELPSDPVTPVRGRDTLSQTKSELVHKFLQSSVTPSSAEDESPFKFDISKTESPFTQSKEDSSIEVDVTDSSGGDITFRPSEVKTEEPGDSEEIVESKEDKPKMLSLEEIYNQLPPINYDEVTLEQDDSYELPDSKEISEEDVERLHGNEWLSVNGCQDDDKRWYDWTQTLSRNTHNNETLHLLPYVVID